MSPDSEKTPNLRFAETETTETVRKPVVLPADDSDDSDDGSRSTKNDREIRVEDIAETNTEADATTEEPKQ